ncbi:hypothetical protein DdX_13373 [Ditylenchus destructor]|uniref:Uncharacterized protein n=1 Tax=Ditylenchus destructor TaxID=166010 RepID=A0AAD4MVA7_9BILA|nr:hypothetical protein DdX_13373 [Ditylenchus destructor]
MIFRYEESATDLAFLQEKDYETLLAEIRNLEQGNDIVEAYQNWDFDEDPDGALRQLVMTVIQTYGLDQIGVPLPDEGYDVSFRCLGRAAGHAYTWIARHHLHAIHFNSSLLEPGTRRAMRRAIIPLDLAHELGHVLGGMARIRHDGQGHGHQFTGIIMELRRLFNNENVPFD